MSASVRQDVIKSPSCIDIVAFMTSEGAGWTGCFDSNVEPQKKCYFPTFSYFSFSFSLKEQRQKNSDEVTFAIQWNPKYNINPHWSNSHREGSQFEVVPDVRQRFISTLWIRGGDKSVVIVQQRSWTALNDHHWRPNVGGLRDQRSDVVVLSSSCSSEESTAALMPCRRDEHWASVRVY